MKIEIYGKESEEDVLRLRLKKETDKDSPHYGCVYIAAVNLNGDEITCGKIIAITPDGKLSRYTCIDNYIGVKINSKGQIIEVVDDE